MCRYKFKNKKIFAKISKKQFLFFFTNFNCFFCFARTGFFFFFFFFLLIYYDDIIFIYYFKKKILSFITDNILNKTNLKNKKK
jgi:hypothetical protein